MMKACADPVCSSAVFLNVIQEGRRNVPLDLPYPLGKSLYYVSSIPQGKTLPVASE